MSCVSAYFKNSTHPNQTCHCDGSKIANNKYSVQTRTQPIENNSNAAGEGFLFCSLCMHHSLGGLQYYSQKQKSSPPLQELRFLVAYLIFPKEARQQVRHSNAAALVMVEGS